MIKDLLGEIKRFVKGSTFDAVLPPLCFVIANRFLDLGVASILAVLIGFTLLIIRIVRKENWLYAVVGFLGIVIAAAFAYFLKDEKNYFLPDIISGGFFVLVSILSLVLKKPLAMWLSHLTRGWSINWYYRKDIMPAYTEVTYLWTVVLVIRLIVLVMVYINGSAVLLATSNIILGFPATIIVLGLTYIYGILRLKKLGGPGIDEFENDIQPPWQGQKKGF